MDSLSKLITSLTTYIWGVPMIALLLGGGMYLTIRLSVTTVVVIIYYGEKQAEFLFDLKFANIMRLIYIVTIFVGAIGGLPFI